MNRTIDLLPARPRVTEMDLCVWLGDAAPGATFEYHLGLLAVDAHKDLSDIPAIERGELARVAKRAMWAAKRELVHLVQRRIAPDTFAYLAIARPRPKSAPVSLSALFAEAA